MPSLPRIVGALVGDRRCGETSGFLLRQPAGFSGKGVSFFKFKLAEPSRAEPSPPRCCVLPFFGNIVR